jgi:hypothetical protein
MLSALRPLLYAPGPTLSALLLLRRSSGFPGAFEKLSGKEFNESFLLTLPEAYFLIFT